MIKCAYTGCWKCSWIGYNFVHRQNANTKVHAQINRLEYEAFTQTARFFLKAKHESKMKDIPPSVLRQEIAYKPLITSPIVQAPQSRSPFISSRHGQTDLMILHSFLCYNNCKQVFKTHKQLHCMGVYQTAVLSKKPFLNYSRLILEWLITMQWQ